MRFFLRLIKKIATAAALFFLSTTATADQIQKPEPPLPGVLRIHYFRSDSQYSSYGLWLWDEVKKPSTDWPQGASRFTGSDTFGVYADINLLDNAAQVGFMVLNIKTGEKDGGSKIVRSTGPNEFWVTENDDSVYDSPELKIKTELHLATVSGDGMVRLLFNSSAEITADNLPAKLEIKDRQNRPVQVISAQIDKNNFVDLTAGFTVNDTPISVSFASQTLIARLDWQLVDSLYAYDKDDLGCNFSEGKAVIKLWAPLATQVTIQLFDKNDQTRMLSQKSMQRGEKGVWQISLLPGDINGITDLHGYYYQFEVTNPGNTTKKVLDPYARSMAPVTVNAAGQSAGSSGDFVGKAAIIEPGKCSQQVSPPLFAGYKKREDAIIYEVHVRDFTSDPTIETDLKHRWGSYRAFINKLPYIKSLGITHVQLLPVMAWYFGDETRMGERELEYRARHCNYNWGYDPQNYFSPDGAYSEKPEDAAARIGELKELIDAIHLAGMGVVLDVAYTHMARASFLNDIVPDYYFFRDASGNFLGDFGNNLATNRKMAAKLMIDSVKYWFREYKIDGMRWDMMGDATQDAVQAAFDAAAAINPQALFIGEGWRTFKGHIEDSALAGKGADQDWMDKTDNVGVFSDEMRNELKSGFGSEGNPMFLTGGPRNIEKIFKNVKGQPTNTTADSPGDTVQYIEAHDNLPLYDIIAQAIKKDPEIAENDHEIHRRIRIGNALVLTAQGTAFLHAGQEYGRSKQWLASSTPEQKFHTFVDADGKPFKHPYFIHDSYDSSDAINKFDWAKAVDAQKFPINNATVAYTRGLIALRQSTDAFRLGSKELIDNNVTLINAPEIKPEDLLIAYSCSSTDKQNYFVFANADNKARTVSLKTDLTKAQVLVDADRAGVNAIAVPAGCKITPAGITINPLTVIILKSLDTK